MRSIVLSLALLAFTCYEVFSQQAYERIYPIGQNVMSTSVAYSTLDNTLWFASAGQNGDIILQHLDAMGNVTAAYSYSGFWAGDVNVEQSINGNIYLSGLEYTSGVQYYILALDFSGNVLWTKKYAIGSVANYDRSRFRILPNGNLMIVESVYGHIGYIEADENTGNVVSSAQLREDSTFENKTPGFAGDVQYDGSFVFSGKRGMDICLVHTDPQGQVLWSSVLNSGMAYYHTKGIAACYDGSTIACGMEDFSGFIMKVDANGVMQWYNAYDGYTIYYDIEQIDINSFGAVGTDGANIIFSRFDMNGNELSTIRITQSSCTFAAYDFEVAANGNIAIPFTFSGMSYSYTPGLMLMQPNAALECGMELTTLTPSTSSADPTYLAVPIYHVAEPVTVTTTSTSRTTLTPATNNLCVILSVEEPVSSPDFSMQNTPAPQGEFVTWSFGNYRGDVLYFVTDATGREVIRKDMSYSGGLQPVDKSDQLAPGIYMMTTVINGEAHTEKFVIR